MESKMEEYAYGLEVNKLQVPCKRNLTLTAFTQGVQDFDWSIGGRFACRMDKSYFRVGLRVTDVINALPTAPVAQANLTFSDNPCAGLWDNCYFRAGGADVSSIINYAPQAHQVKVRLGKSRAWLNGIGKSAHGYNADFQDRVNTFASNGVTGEEHTVPSREEISATKTATLSLAAATGIVTLAGGGADFSAALVGKTLVILGYSFVVTTFTDTTHIVVAGSADTLPNPLIGTWENSWFEAVGSNPPSEQKNEVYFMYQPPIGIFNHDKPLGSGEYRIQLNPNSRFRTSVIEALANKTPGTDYNVEVVSCEFYPCIEKANIAATGIDRLFLTEQHIQTKTLTSTVSTLDFTLPPSTMAITVFVQATAAGSDTRLPLTKFKVLDGSDENLKNLQLTYASVTKPSTNWTSEYSTNINYMTQRYNDTQVDSGMITSAGGPESFPEWRKRGGLYHFDFTRDSEDRSTNLQLSMTFGALSADTLCFVCAHYTKTCALTLTGGRISNVQTLSV